MRTKLTVNGEPVEAEAEPRVLLADLLRDQLGLTGTKVACDTAQCGSCVVRMNALSVKMRKSPTCVPEPTLIELAKESE